jgi:hypothetical protein
MVERDILMAIAQVAATFIGFAGVVFAVGRASEVGVGGPERNALKNLLVPSILVLFLAFVPLVASTGVESEGLIWRASNGLLGAIHLALVGGATRAAIRSQLLEPVPFRFFLLGGGYVAVAANVVVVLGFVPELAPMAYIGGLVWFLLVSAVQFIMLIFLHARVS